MLKIALIPWLWVFTLTSCTERSDDLSSPTTTASPYKGPSFFPNGTFPHRNDWFGASVELSWMGEKPLFGIAKGKTETYRFLKTLGLGYMVLRLENVGGVRSLVVKRTEIGNWRKLAVDRRIPISNEQWNTFMDLLEGMDFWIKPTTVIPVCFSDCGHLMLEGIKDGRYHVVVRESAPEQWLPKQDQNFPDPFRYLLKLSGLK